MKAPEKGTPTPQNDGSEPVAGAPVPDPVVPPDDPASPTEFSGTETVLVVDDEDIVRNVTRRALQRCGYQVLEAAGGRAGLDMIAAHSGDVAVVVLDMVMPEMDGREFFWQLRQTNPEIPVLLNSGFSVDGRVGQLLEAGAVGFLKKPYELVDLLRAVRAAIDGERPPAP